MQLKQLKPGLYIALALVITGLSSWTIYRTPMSVTATALSADTVQPKKKLPTGRKEYHIKDIDKSVKELDEVLANMDLNVSVNLSNLKEEIKLAIDNAQKVDTEKLKREIEVSIKNIDWENIRAEVANAVRNVKVNIDAVELKELKEEMKNLSKELTEEKIQAHVDLKDLKINLDKDLAKARKGIEKAKEELMELKEFTESLEKDGLISKKKGYKLQIKDGELYINGTKQSKEVNEKYQKYFPGKDFVISSDGERIASI